MAKIKEKRDHASYERVKELFSYRDDGCLIWKVTRSNRKKAGSTAGTERKNAYVLVGIDGVIYRAHRIIWLWHHGYIPEGEVDHINRVKHDNRIENLREVSRQCNARNTGNFSHNTSGVKGIYTHKSWGDVWRVEIHVNGKKYNIGNYKGVDEAVLARLAAEQCLNWDGCDSSSPAYRYALNNGLVKRRCRNE